MSDRPFAWKTGDHDRYLAVTARVEGADEIVLNEVGFDYGQRLPDFDRHAEHVTHEVATHIEHNATYARPELDVRVFEEPLSSLIRDFDAQVDAREEAEASGPRP